MAAIPVYMATLIANIKFLVFVYHSLWWLFLAVTELQRFKILLSDQIKVWSVAFHASAKDVIFNIDNMKKVENFFKVLPKGGQQVIKANWRLLRNADDAQLFW